jgi:hypothetical protein
LAIEVWGCDRNDGDYDASTHDQRDNYATHGSIRFSSDATPLKFNAHLACFRVVAKRSRDFLRILFQEDVARRSSSGHLRGAVVSVLLARPYAPSGDFADQLTLQEPSIGRQSPNAMAGSRLHGWLGDCGENLKHLLALRRRFGGRAHNLNSFVIGADPGHHEQRSPAEHQRPDGREWMAIECVEEPLTGLPYSARALTFVV